MSKSTTTAIEHQPLLSIGEAARLASVPKVYLRELAESGRLAVHLSQKDGATKLRVTKASLTDAGLLPSAQVPTSNAPGGHAGDGPYDLRELVALIREQSDRITSLEEQRFQLGAQLGAAVERIASLEERIATIAGLPSILEAGDSTAERPELPARKRSSLATAGSGTDRRLRDLAWRITDAGFQLTANAGTNALRLGRRSRLLARRAAHGASD